jgi:hypothetical protein
LSPKSNERAEPSVARRWPILTKAWGTRITGLVCIALALYFGNLAKDFPANGGTFPIFAAAGTIILSLIMMATSFYKTGAIANKMIYLDLGYSQLKPIMLVVLSVLYIIAIVEIGYFVSSIFFLFLTTYAVGIRDLKAVVLTGIILFPTMYGFFVLLLKAQLPQGILF